MTKEQFVRSEDYRSRYIAEHPGWRGQWYMCPYCGRFVKKDRMQVDHIISIDLANRQPLYRWLVPKEGINSEKNLTAACEKCNLKKSNRGGWWIVRKAGTRLVCRRMGFADSVDSGRSDSDPLRGADSARGAGMAGNGDHKTGSCYAPVCR